MSKDSLTRDETRPPQIIYALYLAGIVTANITLLIGVIIAYVYRKDAAPWLLPHYRYLIRTFWIGTLYACIAFVLSMFGSACAVCSAGSMCARAFPRRAPPAGSGKLL